jgi:hypothetical protein
MELIIGLIIVCGTAYYFFFVRRGVQWNDDAAQITLTEMLLAASATRDSWREELQIITYMEAQGWSKSEMKNRIAHASSYTRVGATPTAFEAAKQAGLRIYHTIDQAL